MPDVALDGKADEVETRLPLTMSGDTKAEVAEASTILAN
jgi:hypothetical protein